MSKIQQIIFSLLSAIFISISNTAAGDLIRLLPDSSFISPFIQSDSIALFTKSDLKNHLNSTADIYLEYGFSEAINQRYSHDLSTISVDIYEMENSNAAFGIYSVFRDHKNPPLGIGDDGVEYDYQVAFWQDKYYIAIAGNDGSEDTKAIIKKTATNMSNKMGHAQEPEILKELPQQYLVPRSQGIINGRLALNRKLYFGKNNILNIDGKNIKAAFASYKLDNMTAGLILVKANNVENAHKIASDVFRNKYSKLSNKEFEIFKDQRGQFYSVKAGANIQIIYKASSENFVLKLLK